MPIHYIFNGAELAATIEPIPEHLRRKTSEADLEWARRELLEPAWQSEETRLAAEWKPSPADLLAAECDKSDVRAAYAELQRKQFDELKKQIELLKKLAGKGGDNE